MRENDKGAHICLYKGYYMYFESTNSWYQALFFNLITVTMATEDIPSGVTVKALTKEVASLKQMLEKTKREHQQEKEELLTR